MTIDRSGGIAEPVHCLAGVDEAGLGPILGPLVVAGVAMAGPEGVDPWRALRGKVTRRAPKKGQIQVADSKKVKSGARGFARLERTVLTFWAALHGTVPDDLGTLLDMIGVDRDALASCPWYRDLAVALPRDNERSSIELAGHLLRRRMDDAGIELRSLALRPVEVAEFNALIAETDNKSLAHFRAYGEVLVALLRELPDGAHVVADRCGGRVHYRGCLLDAGAGREVVTMRETRDVSAYRLQTARGSVRVTFASRGEERAFPTALASCAAKYVRELFVERLNAWFRAELPDVAPTAGYWVDGHRFLDDIRAFAAERELPLDRLVRVR